MVHHICGVHRWEEDGVEHTCQHREYTAEEQRRKKWLTTDSSAFRVVQGIVMDPNILRDLRQMAQFKHTGVYYEIITIVFFSLKHVFLVV